MLILFSGSAFAAEEWRQYRHDWYRTAATSEELRNSGAGNPNAFQILWSKEFAEWPHENANIIIADGALYYSLMDGSIRAIDASANTYTEKWVVNTGASLNNSPAVYDGRVYVVNLRGRVMALDAQYGSLIWEHTVPTDVFSSPLYVNGRIYFGGIDGVLYAFDAEDGGGGPVWSYQTRYGMIDTSPVYHNGKIIFSSENMHAYALDWRDGRVVWDVPIAGDKTWNGSPVVARDANRVVFRTLSSYTGFQGSSYRGTCWSCAGHYDVGFSADPDLAVLQQSEQFFNANRPWANANVVLDTESGQEVRSFNYGGQGISLLPFTSMYWNSIPWVVMNQRYLYAESFRRAWKVDMTTGSISRVNAGPGPYGYYARGDENVLSIGSGNLIIGGINHNLAGVDFTNGNRLQLQGDYATEGSDSTPLLGRTLTSQHFSTFPGDGYTGSNGELVPYRDRAFYFNNGYLFALRPSAGGITDINTDRTAPSAPTSLSRGERRARNRQPFMDCAHR